MKKRSWAILILLFVISIIYFQDQKADAQLNVDVKLEKEMLGVANAYLSDRPGKRDNAVWYEKKYEHDVIVTARFREQIPYASVRIDKERADISLYKFDVLSVEEGTFEDKELRFFRTLIFQDGVYSKLLTLRGDLKFWLKKSDGKYAITSIEIFKIEEGANCVSKDHCASIDCSKYDNPLKSGYKTDCVDNKCKCLCPGCA